MKFLIKSEAKELRFYASDGWNEDLLQSCLAIGDISYAHHVKTKKPYWTLSNSQEVSAFDIARLMDCATAIIGFDGTVVPYERQEFYLKCFAQKGVFKHGE